LPLRDIPDSLSWRAEMIELKDALLKRIYDQGTWLMGWKEWELYVKKAYPVLVTTAKEGGYITYGALGQKIGLYSPDYFPKKIGEVAGGCSLYEWEEGRPLISAIVVRGDEDWEEAWEMKNRLDLGPGRPGLGFWGFPSMPDDLRKDYWEDRGKAPPEHVQARRIEFWDREVKKVHNYWRKREQARES